MIKYNIFEESGEEDNLTPFVCYFNSWNTYIVFSPDSSFHIMSYIMNNIHKLWVFHWNTGLLVTYVGAIKAYNFYTSLMVHYCSRPGHITPERSVGSSGEGVINPNSANIPAPNCNKKSELAQNTKTRNSAQPLSDSAFVVTVSESEVTMYYIF